MEIESLYYPRSLLSRFFEVRIKPKRDYTFLTSYKRNENMDLLQKVVNVAPSVVV